MLPLLIYSASGCYSLSIAATFIKIGCFTLAIYLYVKFRALIAIFIAAAGTISVVVIVIVVSVTSLLCLYFLCQPVEITFCFAAARKGSTNYHYENEYAVQTSAYFIFHIHQILKTNR